MRTTLVIDPQQTQTMYTGGVSGGVWKTTDGGAAWRPTGDTLANIALRVPYKRLLWDAAKMEFTNSPEANKLVRRETRPGWELT